MDTTPALAKVARALVVTSLLAAALASPVGASGRVAPTRTLYFDNLGSPTTSSCTQAYALVRTPSYGHPCGNAMAVVGGDGYSYTHEYPSLSGVTGFRVDVSRKLTGTVYLAAFPPIDYNQSSGPLIGTLPMMLGASIDVYVNGTQIGTSSGSGLAKPHGTFAIPIRLSFPKSLKKVAVHSVVVDVTYTDGAGVIAVSYAKGSQSEIVFPVR